VAPVDKSMAAALFSGYRRQKDSAQHFDRSRGGYPHTAQTPGEHPLGDTSTAGGPGGSDAAAPAAPPAPARRAALRAARPGARRRGSRRRARRPEGSPGAPAVLPAGPMSRPGVTRRFRSGLGRLFFVHVRRLPTRSHARVHQEFSTPGHQATISQCKTDSRRI